MKKEVKVSTVFVGAVVIGMSMVFSDGDFYNKIQFTAEIFKWYLLAGIVFWAVFSILLLLGKIKIKNPKNKTDLNVAFKKFYSVVGKRLLTLIGGFLVFSELSNVVNKDYFNILVFLAVGFLFFYFKNGFTTTTEK